MKELSPDCKQIQEATSPEDILRFAKEQGIAISKEQAENLYFLSRPQEEISEKNLEKVAGGYFPDHPEHHHVGPDVYKCSCPCCKKITECRTVRYDWRRNRNIYGCNECFCLFYANTKDNWEPDEQSKDEILYPLDGSYFF